MLDMQLIAIFAALACAIPGVFLVLKKMSMMADSITHTVLLGIVLAFFIVNDLSSPFLILGAALVGVLTVYLTETLHRTNLLSEDSSVGLVFPLLFSIAIILISMYASNVHLDTDMVLSGSLEMASLEKLILFGVDIGPKSVYVMGAVLVVNLVLVVVFFKELKLAAFDPVYASLIGFSPIVLHYALMSSVSLTAVGAFEAVGSVLVVAFMVGPAATAYILTEDLKKMIILTFAISIFNAVVGFQLAVPLNVTSSGAIAVVIGLTFLVVFVFAPKKGVIDNIIKRKKQRFEFSKNNLLFHLINHESEDEVYSECGVNSIKHHLKWTEKQFEKVSKALINDGLIFAENKVFFLTKEGRQNITQTATILFGTTDFVVE